MPVKTWRWLSGAWEALASRHRIATRGRPSRRLLQLEELESRLTPTAPSVSSILLFSPTGPVLCASSVVYQVTFDQPVTGVDASDFHVVLSGSLKAATPVTVTGGGSTYNVTINGVHGSGALRLDLIDDRSIMDAATGTMSLGDPEAGNGSFQGAACTILQAYPFVASIVRADPIGPVTAVGAVRFTVTFSQAVAGVDAADFQIASTGTATASSIQVTPVSPAVYTVTASGVTGTGALGLRLVDDGSIHDLAGNPLVQQHAPASFRSIAPIDAGSVPASVVAADLNGDGRADLIAGDAKGGVNVLLGNGDGTFQAPAFFPTGAATSCVAVEDVNGDGRPDIVTTDPATNQVDVLLGKGDGTFGAPSQFDAVVDPEFVTAADVNGDGKPDLIVAGSSAGVVTVLLGNGDGSFYSGQSLEAGKHPVSVAVADLNGDGRPDLVVADSAGGALVFLGNGDGSFGAPTTFAVGANPVSVAVADFNGDGRLDLAVASRLGMDGSVLLGNGDGTFQAAVSVPLGRQPGSLTITDVNGDGKSDLVASDPSGKTVTVLLGNGDGTFQPPNSFNTGLAASALATADLNGDGRPDVAVVAPRAGGGVLLSNGKGDFTGQNYFIDPAQVPTDVALTLAGIASPATQLTLDGGFADRGVLDPITVDIQWGDGSPDTVLALAPDQRSFSATHVYDSEGAFQVKAVVEDSGADRATGALVIPVMATQSGPLLAVEAEPGQTATASISDPTTGASIRTVLTLSSFDVDGAELVAVQLRLTSLPPPARLGQEVAAYDIRQFLAEAGDSAIVSIVIPGVFDPKTIFALQYLDPNTDALHPFLSGGSSGVFTFDVEATFVGLTLHLDGASTPTLTDLTGTVFTVTASVPTTVTTKVVSAPLASADAAASATAPVRTTAFQGTSQVTFTLAASQAGQASVGLLSLGSASNSGGDAGTPPTDPADAAWIQFVVEEFGDDPQAIWQYGGSAAVRLWLQRPHPARSAAAPASPMTPAENVGGMTNEEGQNPVPPVIIPAPSIHIAPPAPIPTPAPAAPVTPPAAAVDGVRPPRLGLSAAGWAASLAGLVMRIAERKTGIIKMAVRAKPWPDGWDE